MRYEKIFFPGYGEDVYLECYISEIGSNNPKDALLICPGGAYEFVSVREGEPVALAFQAQGIQTFVLHYSVAPKAIFPEPLIQASLAMKWIREHAEEYMINPKRVFVTGFSAGGHLCASLGTLWHHPLLKEAGIPEGINKPTGILPIYPVISTQPELCSDVQVRCFVNILGRNTMSHSAEDYSLELCVDERTPPAFLVHTSNDQVVYAGNSLVFAQALAKYKIPYELHIYHEGAHGMSVCNEITENGDPTMNDPHKAGWVKLAAEWIKSI